MEARSEIFGKFCIKYDSEGSHHDSMTHPTAGSPISNMEHKIFAKALILKFESLCNLQEGFPKTENRGCIVSFC